MLPSLKQSYAVEFERIILNADGSVAKRSKPQRNLILDTGMDALAARDIVDNFNFAKVGTGNNPTRRDSATTTVTIAGTTATASGAFFVSGDVGRLLQTDSGVQRYITGFTSSTVVTVGVAATAGPEEFTIYYVNDTALQAQSKITNTYGSNSGDNGSTWVSPTYTHKRTFVFSAEVGTVTYREIGWSWTTGTALFGRAVFSGGGDTLIAGQQYVIICRVFVTYGPTTIQAVGDVGNNGFNTAGNFNFDSVVDAATVATSGATQNASGYGFGPHTGATVALKAATFSQSAGIVNSGISFNGDSSGWWKQSTLDAYVPGNYTRTHRANWGIADAVGTPYGLTIGGNGNGFGVSRAMSLKFTTPQTKDGAHTVAIVWPAISWARELIN